MGGANVVLAAAAAIAALTTVAEARTLALTESKIPAAKRSGRGGGGAAEEVGSVPYEGDDDYNPYGGLNVRQRRARAFQRMRREQELKQLYEKIAREFPFVAKQGLKPGQKVPSLDDLFAMTMFGQPNGR